MYYGETTTSIDSKGRITVPKQFRDVMEVHDHDTWFMTRGFDGAVFIFEKNEWEKVLSNLEKHARLDPRMLDFRRMLLGSSAKVKRDNQSRILIPTHLREFAGIEEEAVLLGVEDHLELWSKENWRVFQSRQADSYKSMAADLFGGASLAAAATEEGME